jgi:hypothetical protein
MQFSKLYRKFNNNPGPRYKGGREEGWEDGKEDDGRVRKTGRQGGEGWDGREGRKVVREWTGPIYRRSHGTPLSVAYKRSTCTIICMLVCFANGYKSILKHLHQSKNIAETVTTDILRKVMNECKQCCAVQRTLVQRGILRFGTILKVLSQAFCKDSTVQNFLLQCLEGPLPAGGHGHMRSTFID